MTKPNQLCDRTKQPGKIQSAPSYPPSQLTWLVIKDRTVLCRPCLFGAELALVFESRKRHKPLLRAEDAVYAFVKGPGAGDLAGPAEDLAQLSMDPHPEIIQNLFEMSLVARFHFAELSHNVFCCSLG